MSTSAKLIKHNKKQLLNYKFPEDKVFEKRETTEFIKAINESFGFETSMIDRLALYVLYLNYTELKPTVKLLINGYKEKNKNVSLTGNSIKRALEKLNKTSPIPFTKGGSGVKNSDVMKVIIMLMSIIGNTIILKYMCNSLDDKISGSEGVKFIKYSNMLRECSNKRDLPVPVSWFNNNIKNLNLEYDYIFEYSIKMWECSSVDNVKAYAAGVHIRADTTVDNNTEEQTTVDNNTEEQTDEYSNYEKKPKQLALPMSPGDGTQNDGVMQLFSNPNNNGALLFDNNVLNEFKQMQTEYKKNSPVNAKLEYDKAIAFYDSIIDDNTGSINSTGNKDVDFFDVLKWVGGRFLGLAENALESLKDERINPVFWQDLLPQLKNLAKIKKMELTQSLESNLITMERAVDEMYSIIIHIGIIYFFSTTRIVVPTVILLKFIKAVYNNNNNNAILLENEEDTALTLREQPMGDKSKKNKTNRGKSKKNKTNGGKSKKNKTSKNKYKKNKTKKN